MDRSMKPKDLKYPFVDQTKKVLFHDSILFVPDKLSEYCYPPFCSLFEKEQKIYVEYCSGNGTWIAEKARENPKINWIAIEIKYDRARKIWSKIKNHSLKNLIVIWGEGAKVTHEFMPSGTIEEVYINFPDPWPKRRHWKNRIIQQPFLAEVHRVLTPSGKFTFVTDDLTYSKILLEEMKEFQKLENAYPEGFTDEKEGYGSSFFEELWRSKGKKIRYHEFMKVSS